MVRYFNISYISNRRNKKKNPYGFTCFYIPHKIAQYWVISPLSIMSNILDTCHFEKIIDATIKEQPSIEKNNKYNFIPKNYFIIAPKYHNVCKIILIAMLLL